MHTFADVFYSFFIRIPIVMMAFSFHRSNFLFCFGFGISASHNGFLETFIHTFDRCTFIFCSSILLFYCFSWISTNKQTFVLHVLSEKVYLHLRWAWAMQFIESFENWYARHACKIYFVFFLSLSLSPKFKFTCSNFQVSACDVSFIVFFSSTGNFLFIVALFSVVVACTLVCHFRVNSWEGLCLSFSLIFSDFTYLMALQQ